MVDETLTQDTRTIDEKFYAIMHDKIGEFYVPISEDVLARAEKKGLKDSVRMTNDTPQLPLFMAIDANFDTDVSAYDASPTHQAIYGTAREITSAVVSGRALSLITLQNEFKNKITPLFGPAVADLIAKRLVEFTQQSWNEARGIAQTHSH